MGITMLLTEQQQAADQINQCYKDLGNSNVVNELMKNEEKIYEWQHYPENDVIDYKNHTQYYYHSHATHDGTSIIQHGHFHVFLRRGAIPQEVKPLTASKEFIQSKGKKDNLTHLFAIAMDEYGKPRALFTVNHWVVLGAWYAADVLSTLLDSFKVESDNPQYNATNQWLNNMVCLFKPHIKELLYKRDEVIETIQKSDTKTDVYYNKTLEVTSLLELG